MPVLPQSAADRYREQQQVTRVVLTAAQAIWGTRPPADFDAWFADHVAQLVALLVAGQRRAAAGADEYVAATLEELGTPVAPDVVVDPTPLFGVASDGRPLDSLLYGAVIRTKAAVAESSETGVVAAAQAWAGPGLHALLERMQVQVADADRAATGLSITARDRVGYVRMMNPPSCARCAVLAGRWYRYNDGFRRHPQCFPAGTIVSGPSVEAATRRWYEGELVTLTTASGQKLSLTGNHPVLTRRGWVPANLLEEGDEVVRSTATEGATPLVVPHQNQVPAFIEDVWRAMSVGGLCRMPSTPENFHGDGQGGEVDVVRADGSLRRRNGATFLEEVSEEFLSGRVVFPQRLLAKGGSQFVDLGHPAHSRGSIGGESLLSPLFLSHSGGPELGGFAAVAGRYACGHQSRSDDFAGHAVLPAERELAGAGEVGIDDVRYGHLDGPRWDAPAVPFSVEGRAGYASRGQELFHRLAVQVEPDRIVVLSRIQWSGHVYSLSSSEGWHTANSLIVSNCDCRHIPSREDTADDLRTDPSRYFDSLSTVQQDKIFTIGGAQAIRDGADINQVVNARRGMDIAGGRAQLTNVYGRDLLTTTEGVTKRGVAGKVIRSRGRNAASTPRLMPEAIYEIAESREEALRLLRMNGYMVDRTGSSAKPVGSIRAASSGDRRSGVPAGGSGGDKPPGAPPPYSTTPQGWDDDLPELGPAERRHVLPGEPFDPARQKKAQGGHRWGTGREGKSEFPLLWTDDHVMLAVERAMTRPEWVQYAGDRRVARTEVDGVIIEVASYRDEDGRPVFRHAYPLNGHGVDKIIDGVRVPQHLNRSVLKPLDGSEEES